jgi:CRISPR-associated endonuclease/helicase Cas3
MARVRQKEPLRSKRGDELTDEVIEALADEAERGYELGRAGRVRAGRPSLAGRGGGGSSPRVNVRIPEETYEALRRRAREESRTVSDLTREALVQYVGAGRGR